MSGQHVNAAWRARLRAVPIVPALTLTTEGLVLGAGTVLVASTAPRRSSGLQGQEPRVLALLAAAYGKSVAPSVLGNIERAAKAWSDGDDCLAYIHLAHTGLCLVDNSRASAYRLFLADGALRAGASPCDVFKALDLDIRFIGALAKFNPDQPRVPKGSGRTSGEWTNGEATGANVSAGEQKLEVQLLESPTPARMPPPASSFLGELSAAHVAELGAYAARLLGPAGAGVAAFGLLFIPSPNNVHVEGDVPEIPGLRYSWNRDETQLYLTYDDPDGQQRTFSASLDGDVFRDEKGNVIGRVIGGNRVAIDAVAALPDLVQQDEPRLCPAPAPDRPGSNRGKTYEEDFARQYEDFLKKLVNPDAPTPSGYVYYLPNPAQNGAPVTYDDCQRATGFLFEFKAEQYAWLLTVAQARENITDQFLTQSAKQIAASGGRPVVWIFAEEEAARFARKLFDDADEGREYITVGYVPWTGRKSQ